MGTARYDGIADWYDQTFEGYSSEEGTAGLVANRLGFGNGGLLLDVCCGTGLHFKAMQNRDWQVIGVDLSRDQLRIAAKRSSTVIRADGCSLPFHDGAFHVAVATFIHTDVDDFAGVLRDVVRVLRPGGRFLYIGLHPCFVGPFVKRLDEAQTRTLTFTPGYGDSRRVHDGSGTAGGLNHRVGAKWLPLAEFLGAFVESGLRMIRFEEFGGTIVPWNVLIDTTL